MKLAKSILPLAIIIILFVVAARMGFGGISKIRLELEKIKKDETVLNSKSRILSDSQDTIGQIGNSLSFLFPSQNPAAVVLSQVRKLAVSRGIIITNIKSGSEAKDKSGLSRVDISFDAEGSRSSLVQYLKDFETILPLTFVEKVKLNEIGGVVRATVNIKSFWSNLPQKLPALTESISSLSNDESQVLQELLKLSLPVFVELPAQETSGKTDPFSF